MTPASKRPLRPAPRPGIARFSGWRTRAAQPTVPGVSNLTARLLVAVVFVPGIWMLLYRVHPIAFFLLVAIAVVIAMLEVGAMVAPDDKPTQFLGAAMALGVAVALWTWGASPRVLVTVMVGVPLLGLLVPLLRLGDIQTAGLRAAVLAFGPIYCALPPTFLALLRRDHHPGWVVVALMMAWFSDTGGYFAGRYFGKHKLYEAVSPKKTIEGSIGGLAAVAVGTTWASLHFLKGHLPLVHGLVLAVVGGGLGQAGDLVESLFKRSTEIKDSGGILPGHGGILDRIDAMMYTSTIVYLYVIWQH